MDLEVQCQKGKPPSAWEAGVRGEGGVAVGGVRRLLQRRAGSAVGRRPQNGPVTGLDSGGLGPRLASRPAGQVAPATVSSFPGIGRVHFSSERPPRESVRSPHDATHSEQVDHQGFQ